MATTWPALHLNNLARTQIKSPSSKTSSLSDNHTIPYQSSTTSQPLPTTTMPIGQQDSGATAGAKFVTSTVGNTLGGVTNTVGGVVGALGRGIGETLEGATGSAGRPVAQGLKDATNGIEKGASDVAGGVKRAGEWKS
jgi:hypothetical protein